MALVSLVEIVVVDSVLEKNGLKELKVHAKYGNHNEWVIKGIPADVKVEALNEIHCSSMDDDVKRDSSMMEHIHVIDICGVDAKGKYTTAQTLYRNPDGTYRKRTPEETKRVEKVNTILADALVKKGGVGRK